MHGQQRLSDYENHFSDFDFSDIVLLYNGREHCAPGQGNGPHVCDHYMFHLILSGKGSLTLDSRTYPLRAGQGFFITPGQLFRYQADEADPWEYIWFGMRGDSISRLLYNSWLVHAQPIYSSERWEILRGYMIASIDTICAGGLGATAGCHGLLYLSLAHLLDETSLFSASLLSENLTSIQIQYFYAAVGYIRSHISEHFTVRDIAAHLGLNRSYFSRLFSSVCGVSPAAFINKYRLDIAWHTIRYANLPIGQVAQSVGFEDPAYFTRCFARRYGHTPSQIRAIGGVKV